jgi:hypothetical protein
MTAVVQATDLTPGRSLARRPGVGHQPTVTRNERHTV